MSERLVVDDTSVYMIDEECVREKERQNGKSTGSFSGNRRRNQNINQKKKEPARS